MNNESNNYYVSSRGILKSCDIYSKKPISCTSLLNDYPTIDNNYIIQLHKEKKTIPSLYICGNAIRYFSKYVLPNLNQPFILVTGDCYKDIPLRAFDNEKQFQQFITNKYIVHWYCQNWCISPHNKVTSIPLGLDYHTMTQSNVWGEKMSCQEQEKQIIHTKESSKPFWERIVKGYGNFHFLMTTFHGSDRRNAFQNIPKNIMFYEEKRTTRKQTWETQRKYAFVISPHGNGYDCHRTWEALILGCIPVVKTSPLDVLFKDLPVLILKDWKELTKQLMEKTIQDFKNKYNEFNFQKLSLKYWTNKISNHTMNNQVQKLLEPCIQSKKNLVIENLVICGCVRNSAKYIDNIFSNIEKISKTKNFNVIKVVLSYDISNDNTLQKIESLQNSLYFKNKVKIIINKNQLHNERTQNICNARNKIMDYLQELYSESTFDYYIMMDFDDVCSQNINLNTLKYAFSNKQNWDSISFYNENYYDYWALSIDHFHFSCWHYPDPKIHIMRMRNYLRQKIKTTDFLQCDSSFNGFAIYKYNTYKSQRYKTLINMDFYDLYKIRDIYLLYQIYPIPLYNAEIYDCEHRFFHLESKKNYKAKHVICKQHLFDKYRGEHCTLFPILDQYEKQFKK